MNTQIGLLSGSLGKPQSVRVVIATMLYSNDPTVRFAEMCSWLPPTEKMVRVPVSLMYTVEYHILTV
jgi:hypothetical protein